MKQSLRNIVLAALLLMPFASIGQSYLLEETFDDASTPAGWTIYSAWATNVFNGDTLTPTPGYWGWSFGTNNGLNNSHAILNIYGMSCNRWLVTPSIDLTDITSAQLTVDMAFTAFHATDPPNLTNIADDKFMIIVSTDNGATWSDTNATVWQQSGGDYDFSSLPNSYYQDFAIDLSAYSGSIIRIAFYGESTVLGGDNNLHLDNVIVEETPTCGRVTSLAVIDSLTTSNSITLGWVDTINYNPTYTIYNGSNVVATGVSGTSYTVGNLDLNTEYTFGVVANCSASDASDMRTVTGRTACGPVALPYICGFETDEQNSLNQEYGIPWCTENYVVSSTYSLSFPHCMTGYSLSGSYSLMFYGFPDEYYQDTQAIALPQVDVANFPMNGNQLTFWARTDYYDNTKPLYIATMANAGGFDNMTIVDTVYVSSTTYTRFSIPLISANATHPYVVLATMSANNENIFIDDITLDVIPNCLDIDTLTVIGTTSSSITLSWQPNALNDSATYTVFNGADTLATGVTGTTYTVNNLQPVTTYTLGVQANCADGDATTVTISATTACGIVSTPYTWTFDNMSTYETPLCWTKLGTDQLWVVDDENGNNRYLRFISYWGNVAVLPETDAPTNTLQLRFFSQPGNIGNGDCGTFSVGYVTDVDNAASFVELANYTMSDFATSYNTEKTVSFATAPAGARMAMRHNNTIGYTSRSWHVDDVTVEPIPSCPAVDSLFISGSTDSSITVAWTGSAASYTLFDMADTSIVAANITADSYTVGGLTANTDYTFGLRGICSDGGVSNIVRIRATSECGTYTIPFANDFNSDIDCWNLINTVPGTCLDPYQGLFIFNYGTNPPQYLVTPHLVGTGDGLVISFQYKVYNYSYPESFAVGYSTTNANPESFVWGQELTGLTNTEYLTHTEYLVATGIKYVAVKYTANDMFSLYIDNFSIEALPGCVPVSGLAVGNITDTSATLTWTDAGNNGATYTILNGTDTVASGVSGTSYTVGGLDHTTAYTFGVVSDCADGDVSDAATVSFTTAMICPHGTCNVYINGTDWYGDGWDQAAIEVLKGNVVIGTFTIADGGSGSAAIEVCAGDPISFSWTPGWYDSECGFSILNADDTVVYTADNSTFLGGVFFTLDSCNAVPGVSSDTLTLMLAVNDTTMGTVDPAPGTYTYLVGDTVSVSALANTGYQFLYWTRSIGEAGVGDSGVISVIHVDTIEGSSLAYAVTADMTREVGSLTAHFEAVGMLPADTLYSEVVACDSYLWNGILYTESGTYTYVDSVANTVSILQLTVNQSVATEVEQTAEGSYEWNGQTYTESGTYTYVTQAANGCDSTVTLQLTITGGDPQGIANADDVEVSAYAVDGRIVILGAEGSSVQIFDVSGRCVHQQRNIPANVSVRMPAAGIYLVKIDHRPAQRIVVVR